MRLGVIETARLLGTDEARIYAWVQDDEIPHYEVDGQYRFHRTELLEWATARGLRVSVELFQGRHTSPSLAEALEAGRVEVIEASALDPFLEALVARLPIVDARERTFVSSVLRARKVLEPTMGQGLSVPQARQPIALHGARGAITLAHAAPPIAGAFRDGEALRAMFVIVSPTPRVHLELLSTLSAALQDGALRAAVVERAPMPALLVEARRIEARRVEAELAREGRAP